MVTFFILSHPWQGNSHSSGDQFYKCLLGGEKKKETFNIQKRGEWFWAASGKSKSEVGKGVSRSVSLSHSASPWLPSQKNLGKGGGDGGGEHAGICARDTGHKIIEDILQVAAWE